MLGGFQIANFCKYIFSLFSQFSVLSFNKINSSLTNRNCKQSKFSSKVYYENKVEHFFQKVFNLNIYTIENKKSNSCNFPDFLKLIILIFVSSLIMFYTEFYRSTAARLLKLKPDLDE